MICERCQNEKAIIKETRTYLDERGFHFVLRRQQCQSCGFKFKTIEIEKTIFEALIDIESDE